MEKTLLEKYAPRIEVSESVYTKATGETMDNGRKACVAMVLENETKFLNEAFSNSVGTQRADLGAWKKFCLNLVTVALPTLIAHDLVIVSPMASYSGYITYVQYTSGTNKGQTRKGDVFNDPFRLGTFRDGKPVELDTNFTGSAVVESVELASGESSKEVVLAWTPVVANAFGEGKTVKFISESGEESFLEPVDGKVTVSESGKVAYMYDNEIIPQNDLPIVNAEIKSLPLVAKARRVAVYYSQIAAFQAKQDYGFDLGDQLAEKACGQLAYEIDTEITDLLISHAAEDSELVWSKAIPTGISKAQHYEGFGEIVDIANTKIYAKTKRFAATYMLCARDIISVLNYVPGFKAASIKGVNGPYLAGSLNGLKVFVTPNIKPGKFVLGVNGDDFMSSAAVYAPYMAVVPTQLLGYADGAMSQGFSTMYALEMLNEDLLIAGRITSDASAINVHLV